MKFGSVPLGDAAGAILAHSKMVHGPGAGAGTKPYKLAKGTVLTAEHLGDLAADGLAEIVVARLDPQDIAENAAALRLARAIVVDPGAQGVRISNAGAGRVNLYAQGAGLVRLDRDAIQAVNGVDPMITIATVADYHRADAGGMIATIKIIAYGVSGRALARAEALGARAITLKSPVYRTATLIETITNDDIPSDKGRNAMAARLQRLGLGLSDRVITRHQENELAVEIAAASGEVIFILTGSATSDPMDVGPQALRRAGGFVTRFGMPVDPGNLLFLGGLGTRPVIGLPGCARSPALNGADWVLERVICGIDVTADDIAAMAVGGLLKEIPTRPQPRADGQIDG